MYYFLKDRNKTILQCFKPSSCTILIREQRNPWSLLQLQAMISRHRGAKHFRRYGLERNISLLSLTYLLFVDRKNFLNKFRFTMFDKLSLFSIPWKQSCKFIPLHLKNNKRYSNLQIKHHRYFLDGIRPR